MKIQCDCGKFKAEINHFPENTPGRMVCYCDDCQKFLAKIHREDLLDSYGGTEVIPVYPVDFQFLEGSQYLQCNRLSPNGLNRWSSNCCQTPIGNTKANFPWIGVYHNVFKQTDKQALEILGPVRARIMGKFKKGNPPFYVAEKMGFNEAFSVMGFLLKGLIFHKAKRNPFFKADGKTPLVEPKILPR